MADNIGVCVLWAFPPCAPCDKWALKGSLRNVVDSSCSVYCQCQLQPLIAFETYLVQCSHDPVVAMAMVPMVLSMLLCFSLIEVSDLLLMRN